MRKIMHKPKEGEFWVVENSKSGVTLYRIVLIYAINDDRFMEVLLCNSNLELATSTTVLLDEEQTDLKYQIGINLDLMANIYDLDPQLKKKIGDLSPEAFKAVRNLIDGPNTEITIKLSRGDKSIFRSDKRWVSKKNEIIVSQIISSTASEIRSLSEDLDKSFSMNDPEFGLIYELYPDGVATKNNLFYLESPEDFTVKTGMVV